MQRLLETLFSRVITSGDLTVVDSNGTPHHFGDRHGGSLRLLIADTWTERRIAFDPEFAIPDSYMRGRLVVEGGSLYDFLALAMRNLAAARLPGWASALVPLRVATRRLAQFNPMPRARRNVARHYDIDPRIYDLFLDGDQQYSCAYFDGATDLESAQLAKKRHIAAKLDLAAHPGVSVLDIGCGWGGMALYLARLCGSRVTGITLSRNQLDRARARAAAAGLAHLVNVLPLDYRRLTGRFDRIVSVGMFEHVGIAHYDQYFQAVARLLDDDGVALIHSIGRSDTPTATNPFIARHIFPGGYIPALSEMVSPIERAGLIITDVEVLRLHYAETLRMWRERFTARRAEAVAISGEAFARMWETYLAGAEAAFRYQGLVVFQVQLVKRVDRLPTTRGYMADAEWALAAREANAGAGGGRPPVVAASRSSP